MFPQVSKSLDLRDRLKILGWVPERACQGLQPNPTFNTVDRQTDSRSFPIVELRSSRPRHNYKVLYLSHTRRDLGNPFGNAAGLPSLPSVFLEHSLTARRHPAPCILCKKKKTNKKTQTPGGQSSYFIQRFTLCPSSGCKHTRYGCV